MLFISNIGPMEVVVIMLLALLIFGPKKLPELGRSLGKGIREFRKSTSGLMESINTEPTAQSTPAPTPIDQPAAVASNPAPAPQNTAAPNPKPTSQAGTGGEEMVINLEKEGTGN